MRLALPSCWSFALVLFQRAIRAPVGSDRRPNVWKAVRLSRGQLPDTFHTSKRNKRSEARRPLLNGRSWRLSGLAADTAKTTFVTHKRLCCNSAPAVAGRPISASIRRRAKARTNADEIAVMSEVPRARHVGFRGRSGRAANIGGTFLITVSQLFKSLA